MTRPEKPTEPAPEPAVRNYTYLCLTALVILFLALTRRGVGVFSFLPVLVGVAGVGLRWRAAPIMVLILVSGLAMTDLGTGPDRRLLRFAQRNFRLEDWVLCGAVLAYFAAHYRLQGLTHSVVPVDPRRGTDKDPVKAGLNRDPSIVGPAEIGWLILSLPIWALLAQVCWRLLPARTEYFRLPPPIWQGMVLCWGLGLLVFITAWWLSHLGHRQMSRRQAMLLLQDAVWQETSRDQRRVSRWWTWVRLRRRRKELS
jgi:hypothetical protein